MDQEKHKCCIGPHGVPEKQLLSRTTSGRRRGGPTKAILIIAGETEGEVLKGNGGDSWLDNEGVVGLHGAVEVELDEILIVDQGVSSLGNASEAYERLQWYR
nr:hypothetical protein CFP56_53537 [Quercus suber]